MSRCFKKSTSLSLALLLSVFPFVSFVDAEPDCTPNTWTQKADFGGTARGGAVGFSIGTKAYIGTGAADTLTKDFWEWDQATNVWTRKADFPGTARGGAVGFSIGPKGYIGTGRDSIFNTNDFWEWDQATNVWTRKADFPGTARQQAVGFSIGHKGYIGTGQVRAGLFQDFFTKDFWEWDQATNVWTRKADFGGTARFEAVGFPIGDKGYIGTGRDFISGATKDFWEWDQATNIWTRKADFGGTVRFQAVGFSIGPKGYIGTGFGAADNPNLPALLRNDFWEWDQATNVWTQKADFGGTGRSVAVGFSIGPKGYIGTGGSRRPTTDFWEYCQEPPNQPPDVNQARPSIDTLWPPNHQFVPVSILGVTDPDGDPVTITITQIRQDEPVKGLGDGATAPDATGIGTATAKLRTERSGKGNGRVYTIIFEARDGKGGLSSGFVTVGVPHDQGKGQVPVNDGPLFDSTQ